MDRHLAHQAARCSFAQIERAVDDALRRYDPAEAEKRRREAADARHFDVDLQQVSFDGTVHIDAELDLADALDLNDAITAGAAQLAALGCEESLDVRRSLAAGALARRELTLDLETDAPAQRKRELVIYVHLSDAGVAGVENTRSPVSVEQVKDWCAGTNTTVTVRPVIDLNDNLSTDSYRPTRLSASRRPWSTRPACSRAAVDQHGPPTSTTSQNFDGRPTPPAANLAPLCRGHHRYKTHGGWTVVRTGPTSFTWTSPYGYSYDWDTQHTRHTR